VRREDSHFYGSFLSPHTSQEMTGEGGRGEKGAATCWPELMLSYSCFHGVVRNSQKDFIVHTIYQGQIPDIS